MDSIVVCLGVIQEAIKAVHMQRQEHDAKDGKDGTAKESDAMGDQRVRYLVILDNSRIFFL